MFERMTERARQAVILAQDEARLLKHDYISVEHLLLGLLREEEGLGARTLEAFDVRADDVRQWIRRNVGEGDSAPEGMLPFTPRAKKILELSLREALSLGHNYIGTEHLLLGLVREEEGLAAMYLQQREITQGRIRAQIVRFLSGPAKVKSPLEEIHAALAQMRDSMHRMELAIVQLARPTDE